MEKERKEKHPWKINEAPLSGGKKLKINKKDTKKKFREGGGGGGGGGERMKETKAEPPRIKPGTFSLEVPIFYHFAICFHAFFLYGKFDSSFPSSVFPLFFLFLISGSYFDTSPEYPHQF